MRWSNCRTTCWVWCRVGRSPGGAPRCMPSPRCWTTSTATNATSMSQRTVCRCAAGPTGRCRCPATFVGSWAETVAHVVPHIADQLFHRYQRDRAVTPDLEIPSRDALLALAFEEACRRAVACDLNATTGPGHGCHDRRPRRCRPRPDRHRRPRTAAPRLVHPTTPGTARTHAESIDGTRLPDDTTRLLCCDPILHVVVVNGLNGQPLAAGRTARFANRTQRRAAQVRDGGCVFPGCHSPASWCDLHHVIAYPDGPTDLTNLASLCRHHHRVTHRAGWTMHTTHDGWFWWQTPTGRTFWSQRHQHQRHGPTPNPP